MNLDIATPIPYRCRFLRASTRSTYPSKHMIVFSVSLQLVSQGPGISTFPTHYKLSDKQLAHTSLTPEYHHHVKPASICTCTVTSPNLNPSGDIMAPSPPHELCITPSVETSRSRTQSQPHSHPLSHLHTNPLFQIHGYGVDVVGLFWQESGLE